MWTTIKKFMWQWRGVWVTAPSITVLIVLLRWAGLLQSWEWAAYDQYLRVRPNETRSERIAIVGIDDEDLQKIGQVPIPDGVYAELIRKLKAMEPGAIGLDIYRDLPVEPGHQELVEVFQSTPNLVAIQKVVGDSPRDVVSGPAALQGNPFQLGSNDLIVDADNKVRRSFLYVQPDPQNPQMIYFSFGLLLAGHYLDAQGIGADQDPETGIWKFGETEFPRFEANDGGYIRADDLGYQLLLNYRGGSRHFETIPMRDILENKVPPDWGRDRVILIGYISESSNDLFFVPYSSGLLTLPERMAGIEVHANVISQILSTVLDSRPLIKTWSEPYEWLWILAWSSIGAILTWGWRSTGEKNFAAQKAIALVIAASGLFGSTYVAMLQGWWLPLVPAGLALGGSTIAVTAYIARNAAKIRKTFGRYLTSEVVSNLLENPEGLKMGGERRKITILTSDLRGFTALSERLSPEEVIKILNFYLGYMADVITSYQGTIDEFMGDGILVLFGAPTERPDDPERAIACAVAMELAMDRVNQQMKEWGLSDLEMGIGINTGEVVVGNIGSEKRTKYGIVGSQVNLTYRIESYTTGGQILISEPTLKDAGEDLVQINGTKQVTPKGVKAPIAIYDVGGITGKHNLYLPKKEEVFFPLTEELPFQYTILEGKHLGDTKLTASLIHLSEKGALVKSHQDTENGQPKPLMNLKLNFLSFNPEGTVSEDVYAKVVERSAERGHFYIQFTSRPPALEAKLEAIYKSLKG
jgi:adenylate cyclase